MFASSSLSALPSLEDDSFARGLQLLLNAHGHIDTTAVFQRRVEASIDLPIALVRTRWDDLISLSLPALALGEEGAFLIRHVAGEVATVSYPLIGDFTLLRSWVEKRWNGEVVFLDEAVLSDES